MNVPQPRTDLPASVADELNRLWLLVRTPQAADILWRLAFSVAERQELGESYPRTKLADAYARFRRCTLEHAVLDLAETADLLSEMNKKLLGLEIGEANTPAADSPASPRWDAAVGKLYLGEMLVRAVRVCATVSRYQMVLNEFQAAGWPPIITSPFARTLNPTDAHRLVHGLNEGLKGLRFHSQAGGTQIRWERRENRAKRARV